MKELLEELYPSMLSARFNQLYFENRARFYTKLDKSAKIFLAIASSVAVTGWGLWSFEIGKFPWGEWLWAAIAGMATIVAIVQPIVNFTDKVEACVQLFSKWTIISLDYDRLWLRRASVTKAELRDRIYDFSKNEAALGVLELRVPLRQGIMEKIQNKVLKHEGFKVEED